MAATPVYTTDRVALYEGDALLMLRELDTGLADALITDPPYSSGGMVRGDRVQGVHLKYVNSDSENQALPGFPGDTRDQRSYTYWCTLWLSEALRVVKPGGIAAVFCDWRQLPTMSDALQAAGFVWRGIAVWCKPNGRRVQGRYANNNEYIIWGTHGPRPLDIIPNAPGGHFLINTPRQRVHITQKPIELMRELIHITPAGGVVLDPFTGSGTTGLAALAEGRAFVGIELDPHWCTTAAHRLEQANADELPSAEMLW